MYKQADTVKDSALAYACNLSIVIVAFCSKAFHLRRRSRSNAAEVILPRDRLRFYCHSQPLRRLRTLHTNIVLYYLDMIILDKQK